MINFNHRVIMTMFKKYIIAIFICLLLSPAYAGAIPEIKNTVSDLATIDALLSGTKQAKTAAMFFKTGKIFSGMNKICYYDCLGSEAAITISSIELCPL